MEYRGIIQKHFYRIKGNNADLSIEYLGVIHTPFYRVQGNNADPTIEYSRVIQKPSYRGQGNNEDPIIEYGIFFHTLLYNTGDSADCRQSYRVQTLPRHAKYIFLKKAKAKYISLEKVC